MTGAGSTLEVSVPVSKIKTDAREIAGKALLGRDVIVGSADSPESKIVKPLAHATEKTATQDLKDAAVAGEVLTAHPKNLNNLIDRVTDGLSKDQAEAYRARLEEVRDVYIGYLDSGPEGIPPAVAEALNRQLEPLVSTDNIMGGVYNESSPEDAADALDYLATDPELQIEVRRELDAARKGEGMYSVAEAKEALEVANTAFEQQREKVEQQSRQLEEAKERQVNVKQEADDLKSPETQAVYNQLEAGVTDRKNRLKQLEADRKEQVRLKAQVDGYLVTNLTNTQAAESYRQEQDRMQERLDNLQNEIEKLQEDQENFADLKNRLGTIDQRVKAADNAVTNGTTQEAKAKEELAKKEKAKKSAEQALADRRETVTAAVESMVSTAYNRVIVEKKHQMAKPVEDAIAKDEARLKREALEAKTKEAKDLAEKKLALRRKLDDMLVNRYTRNPAGFHLLEKPGFLEFRVGNINHDFEAFLKRGNRPDEHGNFGYDGLLESIGTGLSGEIKDIANADPAFAEECRLAAVATVRDMASIVRGDRGFSTHEANRMQRNEWLLKLNEQEKQKPNYAARVAACQRRQKNARIGIPNTSNIDAWLLAMSSAQQLVQGVVHESTDDEEAGNTF
jgi:hypothetical protein